MCVLCRGLVWKTVFDSYDQDHGMRFQCRLVTYGYGTVVFAACSTRLLYASRADGYLSVDELWKCVAEMGIDKTVRKQDIAEAIRSFDTNGDGRIDLKEYVKWLTDQDI